MLTENEKREQLRLRYENWIKKNKTRLYISAIIYLIIVSLNYFILKNDKIFIAFTILFFSYAIYIHSLVWFINKKLIAKIDEVDFKTK